MPYNAKDQSNLRTNNINKRNRNSDEKDEEEGVAYGRLFIKFNVEFPSLKEVSSWNDNDLHQFRSLLKHPTSPLDNLTYIIQRKREKEIMEYKAKLAANNSTNSVNNPVGRDGSSSIPYGKGKKGSATTSEAPKNVVNDTIVYSMSPREEAEDKLAFKLLKKRRP